MAADFVSPAQQALAETVVEFVLRRTLQSPPTKKQRRQAMDQFREIYDLVASGEPIPRNLRRAVDSE